MDLVGERVGKVVLRLPRALHGLEQRQDVVCRPLVQRLEDLALLRPHVGPALGGVRRR
jgi:hypothetical protein